MLTSAQVIRLVVRSVQVLLLVALLSYPADWLVWRLRGANGVGTVTVNHMTAATLKGNKEELYVDGAVDSPCSRSLYPQGAYSACWWLRNHTEQVQQF